MAAPDIDSLFKLPPGEFTAARNALVSKLKKAGKIEEAEQVRALAKPSISAWAVNQLYWRHRKAFDEMLRAGEQFKKAQQANLAGKSSDIKGPLEARRQALADLSRLAASLLEEAGHHASPEMMRRINTTLEALATYGSHPGAPPAGRLIDDVEPPGFEALAALIPRGGHARRADEVPRVIPFQARQRASRRKLSAEEETRQREAARKEQKAEAKAAVQEAERALREAKKAAQKAEAELKSAAARAKQAEKEKAAIEARYEALRARAEAARSEARRVAAEAEEAAQAVEEAELALEKAKRQLESVE